MPKKNITLNKTNKGKLTRCINKLSKIENKKEFSNLFNDLIISEIRSLKDCTEKYIVEFYVDAVNNLYEKLLENSETITWTSDHFSEIITPQVRSKLAAKYTSSQEYANNIDIYFNEVKREYILHPMNESDDLEFLPENRDIFIKNNLKLVINCAKRYRNLGLPFEDLIQIGNEGLLVAFNKFDTEKANLQRSIKEAIDNSELEYFNSAQSEELIKNSFIYDKDLEYTLNKLPDNGFASKDDFKNWVTKNVKKAVFASVAFQWIRAYILSELSNASKIIKIPASAQRQYDEEFDEDTSSSAKGSIIISLDSINPVTDDCYHDNEISSAANEAFLIEDNAIDRDNSQQMLKKVINNALSHLSDFDRRVVKKKFGIGFPDALNINDIAESEGLPANKIKYIINQSVRELAKYITDKDKELIAEALYN